jgi:hypothetical protein
MLHADRNQTVFGSTLQCWLDLEEKQPYFAPKPISDLMNIVCIRSTFFVPAIGGQPSSFCGAFSPL